MVSKIIVALYLQNTKLTMDDSGSITIGLELSGR